MLGVTVHYSLRSSAAEWNGAKLRCYDMPEFPMRPDKPAAVVDEIENYLLAKELLHLPDKPDMPAGVVKESDGLSQP